MMRSDGLTEHDLWLLGQDDKDLGSEQLHRKRELEKEMGIHQSVEDVFKDDNDSSKKKE